MYCCNSIIYRIEIYTKYMNLYEPPLLGCNVDSRNEK